MRQKEKFNLKVTRYRTPEGNPTCAIDFEKGEVCQFWGSRKFGCCDVCVLSNENLHREEGFLVPTDECPIWKDKK